jgi:hypothetical protein
MAQRPPASANPARCPTAAPPSRSRPHEASPPARPRAVPGDLLALQRLAGNRAAAHAVADWSSGGGPARAMVTLPLAGLTHPVAEAAAGSDVRYRMPTFTDLKAVYTDKTLKIPESVIKDRVARLLGRMSFEKRLKTKDDVPTIIGKVFPAPGKIDQTEFEAALDAADRSVIYQSVLDANTTVKTADKPKLKTAMTDAATLISTVETDAAGMKAVFGAQAGAAKTNYGAARKALGDVSAHMDTAVSTDYNLDDPEVFLGGWASFGAKHMHLLASIAQVLNEKETKATLIHEASHLSDSSVDDLGYYGTPGFEAMDEAEKVANAAHYEELPRRAMGTSLYPTLTFTAGVKAGGGKITRADTIRRLTSEYLRQAWDAAVDTHSWLRGVRKARLAGNAVPFTTNKALIGEVSLLMSLTIHAQDRTNAQVTALDVTLVESIAHGVGLLDGLASGVTMPAMGKATDAAIRAKIVAAAVAQYGNLLTGATRNKALLDWLVAHYHSLPSAP